MRTRGRGESQIPKILRTSYVHGPFLNFIAAGLDSAVIIQQLLLVSVSITLFVNWNQFDLVGS